MIVAVGERPERIVALQRRLHVDNNRERLAGAIILIEMAAVGGQHHPSPPGPHPDALLAARMAADQMHLDPRRDLPRSFTENHIPHIKRTHHLDYMLPGEGMPQYAMAHAGAGDIFHLRRLYIEL